MDLEDIKPDISGWKRISNHYRRESCEGLPKISVVIPSLNQGHLISLSLNSFLEQKNVDKELIIVDGGSTDHTLDIVEKYHEHISKIYYVVTDSMNVMLQKGFRMASGDYVCLLLPGLKYLNQSSLCHMAHVAKDNNHPQLLFSGTYLTEESFSSLKDAFHRKIGEIEPMYSYFPFNKTWLKRGFFPTSPFSIWFKRDYFKKIGGFQTKKPTLRMAMFDLLCRINSDKAAEAVSTFWATTTYDKRSTISLTFRDFFGFYKLIFKYFGLVNAIMWLFRVKPFRIFSSTVHRVRSFFDEA